MCRSAFHVDNFIEFRQLSTGVNFPSVNFPLVKIHLQNFLCYIVSTRISMSRCKGVIKNLQPSKKSFLNISGGNSKKYKYSTLLNTVQFSLVKICLFFFLTFEFISAFTLELNLR